MKGLHIAELGGVVQLPDGRELHITKSGAWFQKLLARVESRIKKELGEDVEIVKGNPWPIIHDPNTRFDDPKKKKVVFFNTGRKVTGSILTALLDQNQGGTIVRGTDDSRVFFHQMEQVMKEEREKLNDEEQFPDEEGIRDDFNEQSEVVIMSSNAITKERTQAWFRKILDIPMYHIGDGKYDYVKIPGVTLLAPANAVEIIKNDPEAICALSPMTEGVIELFTYYILPRHT